MKITQILIDILTEGKKLPKGGDCFSSAYDFMMSEGLKNKDLKLVHGMVAGQGKLFGYRFSHAWCEDNDYVYDNANGQKGKIIKMLYYGIGDINPNDCKYYTYDNILRHSSEHLHKGPWEMENKHEKQKWFRG
jgi:hypothetical protein